MTLDELYRDIYSRINLMQLEHQVFELDIIKAINDACVSIRNEYLKIGRYQGFTVREDVYVTTPDYYHPYLNSATLTYSIAPELSAQEAVVAATAQLTTSTISNISATITEGQEKQKSGRLYMAVDGVTGNTYLATFYGRVKSITADNDLKYYTDDVVKDTDTGYYWKVLQDFTNTSITIQAGAYFSRLYWQDKKSNYVTPVFYSFDRVNNLKLIMDMDYEIGFSINGSTLYATPNANRFVIEYVPEWTDVTNRTDTLPITRLIASQVKQEAMRLLEYKVGKQLTDNRVKQDAE